MPDAAARQRPADRYNPVKAGKRRGATNLHDLRVRRMGARHRVLTSSGRDGRPRKVEPQVFDFLLFLVRNRDRVVSRDEIVDAIWQGRIGTETTISTCLKAARQAVGDDGKTQRLIRTVHGRGFRFVGAVAETPDGDDAAPADPKGAAAEATAKANRANGDRPKPAPALPPSEKPILAVLPFDNLSARRRRVLRRRADRGHHHQPVALPRSAGHRTHLDVSLQGTPVRSWPSFASELQRRVFRRGQRAAGRRPRARSPRSLSTRPTAVHLWADSYDREMEDIFAVQDEVTRTIAATLGITIQDVALQPRAQEKSDRTRCL